MIGKSSAPVREAARGRTPGRAPSRWQERIPLAVAAAVGCAIATYLAAVQLGAVGAPWDPVFGPASSLRVLRSPLSRALPVPDAAVGAVAYAAEVALALAGGSERWRTHPWVVLAYGALAAALGAGSVGLVAVQVAVVRAGCLLCLCSAAISIAIAAAVLAGGEATAALRVVRASHARA